MSDVSNLREKTTTMTDNDVGVPPHLCGSGTTTRRSLKSHLSRPFSGDRKSSTDECPACRADQVDSSAGSEKRSSIDSNSSTSSTKWYLRCNGSSRSQNSQDSEHRKSGEPNGNGRHSWTLNDDEKKFASVSSNNDDEKRDPFSPNLKDQIRAVSSPSLSENPSEIIKFSSERSAASDLVSNTGSGDSSNQNYAGVLQKFKKTFSQFKTTGKQQIPSSQQQLQQQQQQQQSKSDLGSGSVNQITDLDPARYRFGHLVWRSSKERRKTKHNRRDKCNSGDSGIQIELESEEIYHTDGLDSIEIPASAINIRVRRVNSAKAANTMTSYSSAKAKALKKIESYDNKITATPIPKRSLSQPSGLDRMTRTDFDESDTDSVSSHPDFHDGQRSIYAEVLFPFSPVGPQELALERGNLIEIIRKDSGLWWYGRIKNDAVIEKVIPPRQGWFPKDFVRIIPITFGLDPGDDDDDAADLRLSSNAPEKKINTRDLLKHCDTNRTATQLLANNTTTIGPLKGILLSPSQQQNRMQQQNSESLRMSVIRELLETEINYVKLLSSLCLGYLKEMRKRIDIFTPESLILIFSNIESIWRFQQTFLDALRKGIENDRIAQVFLNNQNGFMVYSMYCNAYPRALMELESYTSSKDAKCILENCRIAENLPELPLSAHLLAPIQRICRYPLHLAELVKHSTLSSSQAKRTASSPCLEEDANSLSSQDIRDCKETLEIALAAMKKVTEMVNEGKRHSENLNRFQTSFESFEGSPIAFHSTRFFMQTDATRVSPNLWNNTYTLFLFDHQLIYCKKDILKRNHYIYKGRIFLDDCRILNLPDGKLFGASLKNALRIYCQSRNKWFDFCFRSASRKIRFLSTLAAERQFCGTSLFVSELAGDEDDNLSDREYHSDYDTMERGVNAENVRNMNLNWKESLYDAEKLIESPSKQLKFSSDTLPKKSRKVAKDGYEYNTGSLGRRKIGNWFRKAKSTNTTPTQSPTHHSMLTFNSDSSSQSSPALGYMGNKSKVKDPIISS